MESVDNGSSGGGIVAARGTNEGVVLRLDGHADGDALRGALGDFLEVRRGFLQGNEVILEWVGKEADAEFVGKLRDFLTETYNISVKTSRMRSSGVADTAGMDIEPVRVGEVQTSRAFRTGLSEGAAADIGSEERDGSGLFGGVEALNASEVDAPPKVRSEGSAALAVDSELWDDPNARILYATLRSGQKIETEHTLVVLGDVNSGAEVVAGGDVIILGSLRGLAHAGAYDETGGGRAIVALDLRPTQLRIGMVISRGGGTESQGVPEIARVDGDLIVVEPYQARTGIGRKRIK